MSARLVEIQPCELKFIVEAMKQSSCVVDLTNVTDQHVAFKVKTTSPKKYCVRPNVGIIMPESTCPFTVTMQAQKSAPVNMQCKDKFLIQCTVVPFDTTEAEIPPIFAKDSKNYIEETKLRVVLTSPPQSPVLLPVNGVLKPEQSYHTLMQKDKLQLGVENSPPELLIKNVEDVKLAGIKESSTSPKAVETSKLFPTKDEGFSPSKEESRKVEDVEVAKSRQVEDVEVAKSRQVEDVEVTKSTEVEETEVTKARTDEEAETKSRHVEDVEVKRLSKDIQELKIKMNALDSKLIEAENTITKLKEENSSALHEKETLKQELVGDILRYFLSYYVLKILFIAIFPKILSILSRNG
ncbi:vesicle-associated 2-2-like [Olea europaea subsp. europaea]|uniref:Vesicle-associated 2-2-like n=1 Tax=Olea europaea subsp. europaea TaxID=158383 RepID=A0A8S0QLE4_OLEEU|nr:vesicle-associated 2-2-like [Olea europaea subsp. europaea]